MSRITESQITAVTTADTTDLVRIVDGGASRNITAANLWASMLTYMTATQGLLTAASVASGISQKRALVAKTANYTITTSDATVLFDVSPASTDLTATLPTAASAWDAANSKGQVFTVKMSAASGTNSLIIATPGVETIDGSATFTLTYASANLLFATVQSDGSNWWVIS